MGLATCDDEVGAFRTKTPGRIAASATSIDGPRYRQKMWKKLWEFLPFP